MTDGSSTVTLLTAILAELRGLRSDLAARQHTGNAGHADDADHTAGARAIDALVTAVADAFGDQAFTVSEVIDLASADSKLLAALESSVGALGSNTAKRLGQLFRSSAREGKPLKKIGACSGRSVWSVGCATTNSTTHIGP